MKLILLILSLVTGICAAQTWQGAVVLSTTPVSFTPSPLTSDVPCTFLIDNPTASEQSVTVKDKNGVLIESGTYAANVVSMEDDFHLGTATAPLTASASDSRLRVWGKCKNR